jgi:hypothetical protein
MPNITKTVEPFEMQQLNHMNINIARSWLGHTNEAFASEIAKSYS